MQRRSFLKPLGAVVALAVLPLPTERKHVLYVRSGEHIEGSLFKDIDEIRMEPNCRIQNCYFDNSLKGGRIYVKNVGGEGMRSIEGCHFHGPYSLGLGAARL